MNKEKQISVVNDSYIIEKDFYIDEYRCVIIGHFMGHRCGYIQIPQEHKYYKADYDSINVPVHGGWTFSDFANSNYPVESPKDSWWIGFDCAHFGDAKDFTLINACKDTTFINNVLQIEQRLSNHGVIRTTKYVEEELINAVEELKKIV